MVLALVASLALAQSAGTFADGPIAYRDAPVNVTSAGAAFTALALTTARTTDALKVKGYRFLKWSLRYAYGAATAVTMTCQSSEDNSTWSDIHVLQYVAYPTASSAPQVWSYAAGAAKNWDWLVPVRGVYARCTFAATGSPTASDTLTVTARAGY